MKQNLFLLLKADAETAGNAKEKSEKPASASEDKAGDKPDEKAEEKKEEPEDDLAKLTPAELKAKQQELKDRTRGARKPKAKEEKPVEKAVEKPADKPADKPKGDAPPAPPAAKPAALKAAAPSTPAAPVAVPPPIAEAAPAPRAKVEDGPKTKMELTPVDIRDYKITKQMEEDGLVDKGFADKMAKWWEIESKYQSEWEAKNPGQKYDKQESEHAAFYDEHEVVPDPDLFEVARDNYAVKQAEQRIEEKTTAKEKAEHRKKEMAQAEQDFARDAYSATTEMIALAVPEFAEIMGADKKLDKETTEKMTELNGRAVKILQAQSEKMRLLLTELGRLSKFDDVYKLDNGKVDVLGNGEKFRTHVELVDFIRDLETEMLKLPPEKTMRGGKRLVDTDALVRAQESIVRDTTLDTKAKREAFAKLGSLYYTLDEKDFRNALVGQYAAYAREDIAEFSENGTNRTQKPAAAPSKETAETEKEPEGKTDENTDDDGKRMSRTRSPSLASASDMSNPTGAKFSAEESDSKKFAARTRGR